MKLIRLSLVFTILLTLHAVPVRAESVEELKLMIEELRRDYETKIGALESKIEELQSDQTAQVSEKVEEKLAVMKEEIKKDIEAGSINVDYVGRYEGPFQKGGLIAEFPSGFGQVSVGGYMDHEFIEQEGRDSFFDQHRWIINIGALLGERLRFYSEYEIEHGGPDASGGGEAKVEQAWVDYLIEDWINFRAGALLVPFGRYNLYHDSDLQDLTDRPLVIRDVIPSTWTESGAGFHGEFNPKLGDYEDLTINYETYVVNGLNDSFTDTGMGGARGSLKSDNNNSKAVVGRVSFSPLVGHELGISAYRGKYNDFGDRIVGKGVDVFSAWGPLELVGEYAMFDVDVPDFATTGILDVADKFEGYYLQANYHFWPEFLNDSFLGRGFDDPTFTLVGRYGWIKIDDDADSNAGDNEEERYTLGLNYRPVESWVFKMEYQWNDTEREALERGDRESILWSVAMGF
jgi:hypothetical protein